MITLNISFVGNVDAENYNICYRPVGSVNYVCSTTVNNNIAINSGIVCGVNYEGYVETICNSVSGFKSTQTQFFTTGVACQAAPADTTAPGAPTNLTGFSNGPGIIDLSWTVSTGDGPITYEIYRENSLLASTINAYYSDNAGDTVVRAYKVRARDNSNNYSVFSNVVSIGGMAASSGDTTPPPAVTLNMYGTDPNMYASWTASNAPDLNRYQLLQSSDGGVTYYSIYSGLELTYGVIIAYGETDYFKVQAFDNSGNYSMSNIATKMNNCFVEGTMITLVDGSQAAIETLALNQLLLSADIETLQDTNNVDELYSWSCDYLMEERITSPIINIHKLTADKTIIINNGLLEATPKHSQLIKRAGLWKFVTIETVMEGDYLYNINGEEVEVTTVTVNTEIRNIYPMTLAPSHTYFANGILTHNIKPQDPAIQPA